MPSLSKSTDTYADKLYVSVDEDVFDLAATVSAKADKADTYTIASTNTLLDNKVDAWELYTSSESIANSLSAKADKIDTFTKTEVNSTFATAPLRL